MSRSSKGWGKSFGIGCVLAIALVSALSAQTKEAPTDQQHQVGMMADCQKMMSDMKAGQAKLDDLIAKMNAATGPGKIDQMAAVLTELVAQQKAMHSHMMSMGHTSAGPGNAPNERVQPEHDKHH